MRLPAASGDRTGRDRETNKHVALFYVVHLLYKIIILFKLVKNKSIKVKHPLYLSWLAFPCSQSEEGHLPARVENCKVIHASQKHLKKKQDKERKIQSDSDV